VGSVSVVNATVAANQALGRKPSGGGVDLVSGKATSTNSIISGDSAGIGPDCDGAITSKGHNLLGSDSSCSGFISTGDLVNTDPILGALQDYGGPTQTMALGEGSPAIDAADDAVCAAASVLGVDQRGLPRFIGARCDIGAFEVQLP
jgi:hypothetical protein